LRGRGVSVIWEQPDPYSEFPARLYREILSQKKKKKKEEEEEEERRKRGRG